MSKHKEIAESSADERKLSKLRRSEGVHAVNERASERTNERTNEQRKEGRNERIRSLSVILNSSKRATK